MRDASPSSGARDAVERRTRDWLTDRYRQSICRLDAGDAVWDEQGRPRRLGPFHFQELLRKVKIFRWLDALSFTSFLDVGSGFDWYPELVRRRYGARVCFSDFTHEFNLPYGGDLTGRLDHAVTMNAARLPFADGAFDVVLASEVLEHLVRPVEVLAELVRVARNAVVLTSLEALAPSPRARWKSHARVDPGHEHVERNFFLLPEFAALLGPRWWHESLFFDPDLPVSSFAPPAAQERTYAALDDRASLRAALALAARDTRHGSGAMGILAVKAQPGTTLPPAPSAAPALIDWIMDQTVDLERRMLALAAGMREGRADLPDRDRPVAGALLAAVRCPDCRGELLQAPGALSCPACCQEFPAEYGVPLLYPHRPADERATARAAVDRLCGDDRARRRRTRRLMRRLRRNERPRRWWRRIASRLARVVPD